MARNPERAADLVQETLATRQLQGEHTPLYFRASRIWRKHDGGKARIIGACQGTLALEGCALERSEAFPSMLGSRTNWR
jgi:hypothetical protein